MMCGPAGSGKSTYARRLGLVTGGEDVVLDFSFATRAIRDAYRELLSPVGVVPETVFMATDRDTVLQRVRDRRNEHADDLHLDDDLVLRYFDAFEMPTPDEGPLTVVS